MGLEPWLEHIIGPPSPPDAPRTEESERLLTEARARGITAEHCMRPTELLPGARGRELGGRADLPSTDPPSPASGGQAAGLGLRRGPCCPPGCPERGVPRTGGWSPVAPRDAPTPERR